VENTRVSLLGLSFYPPPRCGVADGGDPSARGIAHPEPMVTQEGELESAGDRHNRSPQPTARKWQDTQEDPQRATLGNITDLPARRCRI
jgi:hypothetical protein